MKPKERTDTPTKQNTRKVINVNTNDGLGSNDPNPSRKNNKIRTNKKRKLKIKLVKRAKQKGNESFVP